MVLSQIILTTIKALQHCANMQHLGLGQWRLVDVGIHGSRVSHM